MARTLQRYEEYTRQEIHDVFDPVSLFNPDRGVWALHDVIRVPHQADEYLFLVTFGQDGGSESITRSGLITWHWRIDQRPPRSLLGRFIQHTPGAGNLHLFLRTNHTRKYTYMGLVTYQAHIERLDTQQIWWQILQWELPDEKAARLGLRWGGPLSPPLIPELVSDARQGPHIPPMLALLGLSPWPTKLLSRAGIQTPDELSQLSRQDLKALGIIGEGWYLEIENALHRLELRLIDDKPAESTSTASTLVREVQQIREMGKTKANEEAADELLRALFPNGLPPGG